MATVTVKMTKGAGGALVQVPRMHGYKVGPPEGLSKDYWFKAVGSGGVTCEVDASDAQVLVRGGAAFGGRAFEVTGGRLPAEVGPAAANKAAGPAGPVG